MHKKLYLLLSFIFLSPCYAECPPSMFCDGNCRYWGEAEYLLGQIKNAPEPIPLITTGPIVSNGTQVLDQPGTTVVLGGNDMHINPRNGARFTAGMWVDEELIWGGEISYVFLGKKSKRSTVSSSGLPGSPFFAFPFINALTGNESSTPVAIPGVFAGKAQLKLSNGMQGAELNALYRFQSCDKWDIRALAGFLYWSFNEHLTFSTNSPFVTPPFDVYETKDSFHTCNQFYGGQIGIDVKYTWCDFFIRAKAKLALGSMQEHLNISGKLITNDYNNFGKPLTYAGGYIALPSNIGKHRDASFSVIPEVNFNLGYRILDCLSLKVGYTFLYVNRLLRPGKTIDRVINPTQAVTIDGVPQATDVSPARPKALLKQTDFWAQSLNAGFSFEF